MENAYQLFGWFMEVLPIEFEKFVSKEITLTDLRQKLDIEYIKGMVDEVRKSIGEQNTADDRTN